MHEEATASETDRVIHRNQVTIGSVDANADAVAATGEPVTYNEIFIFRFAAGPSR
jgi:ketosteroid isomerase-like protein